jgi:predicted Ser/Thr protein kinase
MPSGADIWQFIVYMSNMTSVDDIEKAIAKLKPNEIDRLRAWFEEFQAARFDERIAQDARAGKLDRAADQALADHRKGRSRVL